MPVFSRSIGDVDGSVSSVAHSREIHSGLCDSGALGHCRASQDRGHSLSLAAFSLEFHTTLFNVGLAKEKLTIVHHISTKIRCGHSHQRSIPG